MSAAPSSTSSYTSTSQGQNWSAPYSNCELPDIPSVSSGGSNTTSSAASSVSSSWPYAQIGCEIESINSWDHTVQFEVVVTNHSNRAMQNWQTGITLAENFSVSNYWNAEVSGNSMLSITNTSWNGDLESGQSVTLGIQASYTGDYVEPKCTWNYEAPVTELTPDFDVKTLGQTVYVDTQKTKVPTGAAKYTIDFGDGIVINANEAWHTYREEGNHDITLTVESSGDVAFLSKTIATEAVEAENTAPLLYPKYNASGAMTWDAEGDEVTVSERAIDIQPTESGYNVTYIVEASDGELKDTKQITRLLCSNGALDSGTWGKINYKIEGMTVIADGLDSKFASGFEWDFGDGSAVVIDQPGVKHTYSQPGTYTLTLQPSGEMIGNFADSVSITISADEDVPGDSPECVEVCNWYGSNYPLCVTTEEGWGWEASVACVSRQACDSQAGTGGVVEDCQPIEEHQAIALF